MKGRIALYCILMLAAISPSAYGDFKVNKTGDKLVDSQALTINGSFGQAINGKAFQQDALASHKGYQYVAYYDAKRHVCLARRKLPDGNWDILRLRDYDFKSNDAHNTISLGICPKDGTIHLAFDHHGHPLHYRVSRKDTATEPESITWDASLFGKTTSELERGKSIRITYPRFWQTPQGGLQFCYRRGGSGNGDRMLVDYDVDTGSWVNTRQIDSGQGLFEDAKGKSETRCSYPNGYNYGPNGRLHATWVWRESSQGSNHDLIYAYSEDQGKTWLNNDEEFLTGPPHVNSPGITVANIGRAYGLMNTHGQAVDSQGRIHVVMWHCSEESLIAAGSKPGEHRWGPPEARRYHHYWRDWSGQWQHRELPWIAGNRPKLFIDKNDNAYMIYCAQHNSSTANHGVTFSAGDFIIAAATSESQWADWKVIHAEKGPFVNEMLGDLYRWKKEGILSVMVQGSPMKAHEATPLRILDFSLQHSVTINKKDDGYRGIWYMNQPLKSIYKYKYSGGLGTYCAKHKPFAVYCDEVKKTFFCYGGTTKDSNQRLIHMVSYYDHTHKIVPRPTILLDKKTGDAHDNPVIAVDGSGYIWIFSTSHGTNRPSYIHRSKKPYNIDAFELISTTNFSYMQAWHLREHGFACFFTKYGWGSDRTICFMTSKDGKRWSAWQQLATIARGHYQISGVCRAKAASAFNYHPEQGGLNFRTNLYYVETSDFGKTWHNADGQTLSLPLKSADNPALVHDYEAEDLRVYLKDIRFDKDCRPVILYITSRGYEAGPENDPRTWTTARWTGQKWDIRPVTTSDNNYDMGSLYIEEDGSWCIIAPTETGPQPYNPGGEMAIWVSRDKGNTWKQLKQITHKSKHNHTYARAPVDANSDFYALWADGHGREPSRSNLYFCNRGGDVYVLPREMSGAFEKPRLVEPHTPAEADKLRH